MLCNTAAAEVAIGRFRDFVAGDRFPCLGAKASLAASGLEIVVGADLREASTDAAIHRSLCALARRHAADPKVFRSLAIVFEAPQHLDEFEFERALWDRIDENPHQGCFGNLAHALAPFGIEPDRIPVSLNVFMNVVIRPDGSLAVEPPLSRAGDRLAVRAETDLIVGLTACSAPQSNNFAFKPIRYTIEPGV